MRSIILLPRLTYSPSYPLLRTILRASSISPRFASTSTPRARPKMDKSLSYTPDRGIELAENVADVRKEIEAIKPDGSSVSLS